MVALVAGDTLQENIDITSIDGTTAVLTITIRKKAAQAQGSNNVAVINDTLTTDTGELRYVLDSSLAAGRLEVKVKRRDDSFGSKDAFIKLFTEGSGSNSNSAVYLRIKDDSFTVEQSNVDASSATVVLDEFMNVVITWEYANGDTSTLPMVMIQVDNVVLGGGSYTPTNAGADGGVDIIAFQFGDNGSALDASATFTVDDIAIYSNTAGTGTAVFTDDFESYADGDSLDTDNSASPYNSSTSEAVVKTIGSASKQAAVIRDTLTTDTGELRYVLDSSIAAGKLEVKVKRRDDSFGSKDAFIKLFTEGSGSNSNSAVYLRIKDDSFTVEQSNVDASSATVVLDEFMNVVITWEYANGDTSTLPMVMIQVDNVVLGGGSYTPTNAGADGGVDIIAFQFGDNGSALDASATFTLDDIAIYSNTAGTGTAVFTDDFESYAVGDSLDTDNSASPYNSSTSEAVVETIE